MVKISSRQPGALTASAALVLALAGCATTVDPVARAAERRSELPAPAAERLTEDVRWLADDARVGRRAGTPGERAAAEWIAARLASLGLEPAGTEGYLQPFEVPLPARDGGASTVGYDAPIDDGDATYAVVLGDPNHLVPLFCSAAGRAEGRVVFAGYGIVAPELGWDDYAGRELDGAIVVIVRGTPPDEIVGSADTPATELENPHGALPAGSDWQSYGSIFHKVMEAKRRGAAAVLIAVHPDREEEPLLAFDAGRTAQANLPALMIRGSLAEALVPAYAELVAALDRGEGVEREALPARTARVRADVRRGFGTATNVIGRLAGSEPNRTVVVGAHFDHLGRGGPGSLARDSIGEIHNGADDNASGTAAVLELARCLAAGSEPDGDVIVALWSGEELGLLGSEHWAAHPTVRLADVRANLNFDMVGRADDGALQVLGAGTSTELANWLDAAGPGAGLQLTVSLSGQGVGGSDHQTFLKREIPALHFFSGVHPDYHKPSDDAERFEADGARRVTVLALDLLTRIQAVPKLAWVPPPPQEESQSPGGFRTRFGSVPEYSYQGEGLLLAGSSAGSPAERAGLIQGDLILAIDDLVIEGIGDFMYALNAHKPGDVVLVKYLRDGEQLEVHVTLESTQVE